MSKASATKQFLLVNSVLVNNQSEKFIETFPSDIAQAIIGNPARAGQEYERFLLQLGRDLLMPAAPVEEPKLEPTEIELGEFIVNYDKTIKQKLAAITNKKVIGYRTDWATDEKFPDARKGKRRYKASAVCFLKTMPDQDVAKWCTDNKKIRATPKEGIDIARVSPRPKLDNVMPLALVGQFFVDADRRRYALCFYHNDGKRDLSYFWLNPYEQWDDLWWFLVLEELPSVA